jgi:hypothetical protein
MTVRGVQEEEGEEYEYASYHMGGKSGEAGKQEANIESAVLYQPLGEETSLSAPRSQEGMAGGGVRRDVNRICHVWPGCGGNHSLLSRVIKSRPSSGSACYRGGIWAGHVDT